MNVNVHIEKEWPPLLVISLVIGLIFLIPRSFAEVGLSFDQLDSNLCHFEGAIVPKIFGLVRALVGFGIGMSLTYAFSLGGNDPISTASSGSGLTIVLAIVFYLLPYAVAFCNSDWTRLVLVQ